jgi:glycosyl transferase, family 25
MKTFVISLKRSLDRRAAISRQLEDAGISFEFFDAIDGLELTDDYLRNNVDMTIVKKWPDFLSRGAIGCALSHYSVYKKIVESGEEYALIMEDDMKLNCNIKKIIENSKNHLNNESLLLFYFQSNEKVTLYKKNEIVLDEKYSLMNVDEYKWLGAAGAYVIHRDVAKKMMQIVHPIHTVADSWTTFREKSAFNDIKCIIPFPITPAGLKSEIDYLNSNSIYGKLSSFINRYKVFPLYQMLLWKRQLALSKMNNYEVK